MIANETPLSDRPGPVVVAAGRRVDAPDASTPRFPSQNVPAVRARVEEYLRQQPPSAIVSSAACGADLIVLQVGRVAQVPCHVLLPSPVEQFRQFSVTDRPGDWGTIYDQVLRDSSVEVHEVPPGQEGYLEVNRRLLDRARALAAELGTWVAALIVWNGESRGQDDVTAQFLREAGQQNLPVTEIATL